MSCPSPLLPAVAALALTSLCTGATAAELRFEGEARMGVVYRGEESERPSGWSLESRTRLTLRAEGQTDGGLTFGAKLRLDRAQRAAQPPGRRPLARSQ